MKGKIVILKLWDAIRNPGSAGRKFQ